MMLASFPTTRPGWPTTHDLASCRLSTHPRLPCRCCRRHLGFWSLRTESQSEKSDMKKAPAMLELAGDCDLVQNPLVGPTGVEPARPFGHMPLKHARLPIPPRAHYLPKSHLDSPSSLLAVSRGSRAGSPEPRLLSLNHHPPQIGSPPHSRRSRSRH